MWLLIDKKQEHYRQVLIEETLGDIWDRLEHTPRKSLKCLAQETGVSKSSARRTPQLPKLRPYKTTVIHALKPRDSASRTRFCSWFLQSVVEGEIDPQLTIFSDEARFHLQGYINTQNNRYWSSQNPHLTHESCIFQWKLVSGALLSAKRILGHVFITKQLIVKIGNSFQNLWLV
jgi:hypothetical protein